MRLKYMYGVFTFTEHVFVEKLSLEEIKTLDRVGIGSMRTAFYAEKAEAYMKAQAIVRSNLEQLQQKLIRLEEEFKVPENYRTPIQRMADKTRAQSERAKKSARKAKVKSAKPRKGRSK